MFLRMASSVAPPGFLRIDRLNTHVGGAFDHIARMAEFRLSHFVSFLFASDRMSCRLFTIARVQRLILSRRFVR